MRERIDNVPAEAKYFGCIFACFEKNSLMQNLNGFRLSSILVCLFKSKSKQFGMLSAKKKNSVAMTNKLLIVTFLFGIETQLCTNFNPLRFQITAESDFNGKQ